MMDTAKQHWEILQGLGTDLANKVRSFMVIGKDGDGVMATTDDGQVYCLGKLKFEVSDKSITATEPTPLNIPDLASMAYGEDHILFLNKRGQIYSMGMNYYGQLGVGSVDEEAHLTPQLISCPNKYITVRCGQWHSVALTEDGKCWAWGGNDFGNVDSKLTRFVPSPHQIAELEPYRVVAVECGAHHSLALTDQGEVYGWGYSGCGQLGGGSGSTKSSPRRIHTPSPVRSIASGSCHTLLLTLTGEVYTCGWNDCGQLGRPITAKTSANLIKVADLPSITQIASHRGTKLSIAMSFDQRCFVWGRLDNGKSEDEEMEIKVSTPLKLSPFYSTVDSPLSSFSTCRNTPHSVQVSENPLILSVRMSRMFDNPETSSDVQFVVEQRTIHAHRIILSNSSDYFARMFSETWLAPVDPEEPIVRVTIPDHSFEVFHAFLRFLYTDCLEVTNDLLSDMFELATQYLVPYLQKHCILRMRTTITPLTCCLYYPVTHRHSLPELVTFQQELVQFVSNRMLEVVESVAFQSMEPELRDNLTKAALVGKKGRQVKLAKGLKFEVFKLK